MNRSKDHTRSVSSGTILKTNFNTPSGYIGSTIIHQTTTGDYNLHLLRLDEKEQNIVLPFSSFIVEGDPMKHIFAGSHPYCPSVIVLHLVVEACRFRRKGRVVSRESPNCKVETHSVTTSQMIETSTHYSYELNMECIVGEKLRLVDTHQSQEDRASSERTPQVSPKGNKGWPNSSHFLQLR